MGALGRYRVLDTPPEEAFDRITRLASRILDAPIALVSLVDDHRQWFKSRVGLDASETPRDQAFCAHTILQDRPLVVPDALSDPRFSANPLVLSAPHIRFYAGAPLKTSDGHRLGSLCVIDRRPRQLEERDALLLEDLAGMVMDELELRHLTRQARREVELLELSERVAGVGHWRLDVPEETLEWSAEVFRVHGRDPDQFSPSFETALAHVLPEDRGRVEASVRTAARTGEPFSFEYRIRRADGDVRQVCSRGLVHFDEHGQLDAVFGTVEDITDRVTLETRLRQAERMASLGTLAAGVAHEVNNPLTYMKANTEALREALATVGREDVHDLVDEIHDGVSRIRRIVTALKSFSRKPASRPQPVALGRVLQDAVRLCGNELRHRARLVTEVGANTPLVRGDPSELVQVAVNLLMNAIQAIPSGAATRHEIRLTAGPDGDGCGFFEVADTGNGMSDEVLTQALSPFFTTKAPGEGTGLGLSISHGIVESYGGSMKVTSVLGEGTTVRVVLPVAQATTETRGLSSAPPSSSSPPRASSPPPPSSGGGPASTWRVLVLDDDRLVRKALVRLLRPHEVDVEHDARQVLDQLRAGAISYDAIVCDLMMPSMTGWDFYAALQEVDPSLAQRVVFVTGGAFTAKGRAFAQTVNVPVLGKPVDADTLRAAVAQVIDAPLDGR